MIFYLDEMALAVDKQVREKMVEDLKRRIDEYCRPIPTLAPVEDKPIPQAEPAFEGLKMSEGYAWGPGDIPMLTELLKVAKADLYMGALVDAVERKLLEVLGEPGAA